MDMDSWDVSVALDPWVLGADGLDVPEGAVLVDRLADWVGAGVDVIGAEGSEETADGEDVSVCEPDGAPEATEV